MGNWIKYQIINFKIQNYINHYEIFLMGCLMFKVPFEKIVEAIKEKTQLSDEDINAKIQQKSDQLSGLVSKEGAAHIIANELGVKLFEAPKGTLQIKNILSGMRDVEVLGRVTQIFDLKQFKTPNREGQV